MKKPILIILLCSACGSATEKNEPTTKKETEKAEDSVKSFEGDPKDTTYFFGLKGFENRVQIPYCILLPLDKYVLDPERSDQPTKYIFIKKDKPECYIEVKGLFRADASVDLKTYFENSTSEEETEAQGKILDQKVLVKNRNCFWVTGYWSNLPEQKFIELTFFRKEDVVIVYWSYDMETEGPDSFKFTQEMIRKGSECE